LLSIFPVAVARFKRYKFYLLPPIESESRPINVGYQTVNVESGLSSTVQCFYSYFITSQCKRYENITNIKFCMEKTIAMNLMKLLVVFLTFPLKLMILFVCLARNLKFLYALKKNENLYLCFIKMSPPHILSFVLGKIVLIVLHLKLVAVHMLCRIECLGKIL